MSPDYYAHWIIGLLCTVVWFWGARAGLPPEAISLCATVVPGLIGHAVAYQSEGVKP
jgi:hypothetical protein